jgi:membrane protein involved in colicin uptake
MTKINLILIPQRPPSPPLPKKQNKTHTHTHTQRAVATVPMRVFVHQEERSLQRMYHNSMVAPETWNNFQRCADFVKEENETILAEANGIEEGWGERILSEAHWLDQYINSESKQASSIKAQEAALKKKKEQDAQRKREEIKAKVEAEKAKALAHEKAVAELEKEAKEEEAKKGAKQRKNKSKK